MKKNPFDDAPPEIYRLAVFLGKIHKESDRGAALMAASILDEVLREIILNFLIENKTIEKLVDGFNAPIGTFHSRILAAYAMGLIEEQEFVEIEIIRKIRNSFGHTWKDVAFTDPKIVSQINKLTMLDGVNPRNNFNNSVGNLLGDLLWRAALVKREKRIPKNWPGKEGFAKATKKFNK